MLHVGKTFSSDDKYNTGKTSISTMRNETDVHRYPSVTFCHMFKERASIMNHKNS